MNKVTIKVDIDMSNFEHLSAMNEFFRVVGGHASQQAVAQAPIVVVQEEAVTVPKPKRRTTSKKKETPAVEKVAEAKETPAVEKVAEAKETPAVEKVAESTVNIEEVRALLSKKVGDHRTAIKAKLSDLGAPNVSSLKAENYTEMHTFLTALK